MTLQLQLLQVQESGKARKRDPDTSKKAALAVRPVSLYGLILAWLTLRPNGLTSHELAELTGKSLVSISPRLRPLADRGAIVDSGERRKNPGSKSPAIVWKFCR